LYGPADACRCVTTAGLGWRLRITRLVYAVGRMWWRTPGSMYLESFCNSCIWVGVFFSMYIQIMIWHTKVSTVQLVLLQFQAFASCEGFHDLV
jgi:hypothetical protein